jgi:periplasmic divalent cation tolerance protein
LLPGPCWPPSVRRWAPADAGAHHISTITEASYTKYLIFPRAAVKASHPYDTPAILVLPIESVDETYFAWIMASTGPSDEA